MTNSLEGKVAIITGGGSGIGRESCLAFARAGASVVVADLSEAGARSVAAEIQGHGFQAVAVKTDVSQSRDVQAMVATAVDAFGGLDVLYNNAGISPDGTVLETSETLWETTLAVDLTAVFLGIKYAVPIMQQRGGGVILNTAGTLGIMPCEAKAAYAAAKAGVVSLTKSTALDFAKDNIRSVAICPGLVVGTDLVQNTDAVAQARGAGEKTTRDAEETTAQFTDFQPLPQMITAKDIAALAVFLASDAARTITGATYVIDGGQIAGLR